MSTHDASGGSAIEVDRERVLTFSQAARFVGKLMGKQRVALQTLFRWSTKGCRGVVLESLMVGGARCTSEEALRRFFDRVTAARQGVHGGGADLTAGVAHAGLPVDVGRVLRVAGISAERKEAA